MTGDELPVVLLPVWDCARCVVFSMTTRSSLVPLNEVGVSMLKSVEGGEKFGGVIESTCAGTGRS
jgi:hypothetical protein